VSVASSISVFPPPVIVHFHAACVLFRFELPPSPDASEYFQHPDHPAERCVHCYSAQPEDGRRRGSRHRQNRPPHMRTEGRRPSPRLSACRSLTTGLTKSPHCEVEDDVCRVVLAASRDAHRKPNEFPLFHAKARQPKVSYNSFFFLDVRAGAHHACVLTGCFPMRLFPVLDGALGILR